MGDLPGHSVAITSMCMSKLKRFNEIGTQGKHNPEEDFQRWFSGYKRKYYLQTKLECQTFRETMVHVDVNELVQYVIKNYDTTGTLIMYY